MTKLIKINNINFYGLTSSRDKINHVILYFLPPLILVLGICLLHQIHEISPVWHIMVSFVFFYTCCPNAALVIPSIFRQRQQHASNMTNKCPNLVQTWDRDIVCLLECLSIRGSIKYPRGKYWARLGNLWLIGKIHLMSKITVEEVASEVRSVFKKPMAERQDFTFEYLQPTGTGNRSLTIPSVSSCFCLDGQAGCSLEHLQRRHHLHAGQG